mmetsp:Transcript_14156/g.36333  ORF Transcript_14156/g.36333 Transcript_14156/m.36333 type:complete len:358 (-) Transcript_14156:14-1087(-)
MHGRLPALWNTHRVRPPLRELNAQVLQLLRGDGLPLAQPVAQRAGGAGVQDAPYRDAAAKRGAPLRARLGKKPHAHHHPRLQHLDGFLQQFVAGGLELAALLLAQLVGREIGAVLGLLHKRERAVVVHPKAAEELLGRVPPVLRQAPEALPAALHVAAPLPQQRPLGVLQRQGWPWVGCCPVQHVHPLAAAHHVPKGHPRLHHPKGARVHAQQEHLAAAPAILADVVCVALKGVLVHVVDVLDRRRERHGGQFDGQRSGSAEQPLHSLRPGGICFGGSRRRCFGSSLVAAEGGVSGEHRVSALGGQRGRLGRDALHQPPRSGQRKQVRAGRGQLQNRGGGHRHRNCRPGPVLPGGRG